MVKRLEADLTQAEVAEKMKVSDKTLRAWEYDFNIPDQNQFSALSTLLGFDFTPFWRQHQH